MKNYSSGAFFVAAGIFLSRISGLIRERVFAHFFGNSDVADAFKAALKVPNFLQNLFGEGVLSASFIPVYAQKLAEGNVEEARKIASTIFVLLTVIVSLLTLFGIYATPGLIHFIAPGFEDDKKALTIKLVRILFPGTGLLVLSAWCLGILNSFGRFFLSYVAPVVWNLTIIFTLIFANVTKGRSSEELVLYSAWGLVLGSFLQLAVQWPAAIQLAGPLFLNRKERLFAPKHHSVQLILKNFGPAVLGRGVVQISAYVDNIIASFLPSGAVSALGFAQQIYLLPVSLFAMSISAAELPNFSSTTGTTEEIYKYLRQKLEMALRKVAFLVVPSVFALIFLGDRIVALLYQTGRFDESSTLYVSQVLIGYALGLFASTQSRIYASVFYSLKEARIPLNYALYRVLFSTVLGVFFAIYIPVYFKISAQWGTLGITLATSLSGWIEYFLLRNRTQKKIGIVPWSKNFYLRIFFASFFATGVGLLVKEFLVKHKNLFPMISSIVIIGMFGITYLSLCYFLDLAEVKKNIKFKKIKFKK
ncbi:MAG: murein biosynthesis integral membrane protein MurJ [Bdellovibrionales bacterium]|nr:murein biosynthesis integral membrane protein MurJ [Bdellovibrionales bacterium]